FWLRRLVDSGRIEVLTSFTITRFDVGDALTVRALTPDGERAVDVDVLIPATGFRPDLAMLSELRLSLDPAVEAPARLGPLIDPEFHSCGSVEPHGERVLAHPEAHFYIGGSQRRGRAPPSSWPPATNRSAPSRQPSPATARQRRRSTSICRRPASAPQTSAAAATLPPLPPRAAAANRS